MTVAPFGTSVVITLPAPVIAPVPIFNGATIIVFDPINAESPISVWLFFEPSKFHVMLTAPIFTFLPTSASPI